MQVALHVPAEHTWPEGQTVPQAPQLAGSDCVFTQVPLHSVIVPWHVQTPATHRVPGSHAFPQLPQFRASVFALTHPCWHGIMLAGQVHTPAMQLAPDTHTDPQAPQCCALAWVLTQMPEHRVSPVSHSPLTSDPPVLVVTPPDAGVPPSPSEPQPASIPVTESTKHADVWMARASREDNFTEDIRCDSL